jgi:predicted SAM-dependent methyltransferase
MTRPTRYHLGCGDARLEGWINVDVRDTPATDLVLDLNTLTLEPGTVDLFFSHAFFEHIRRSSRVAHLIAAREALTPSGAICYLGLPDFAQIARLYLEKGPGAIGPVFDLYEVFRQTHGDPDSAEEYDAQMHKSLFDVEEVDMLLTAAAFPAYEVFAYAFPGEIPRLALGFYAFASPSPEGSIPQAREEFLRQFDGRFVQTDTVRSELVVSRTAARARMLVRRGRVEFQAQRVRSRLRAMRR